MVTGQYPFNGNNVFSLFESIAKAEYTIPSDVDKNLAALISGMMCKDEEKRFTIKQIKESAWYKQMMMEEKKSCTISLVDRWRSFSLLPYIQKAVDSGDVPSPVNLVAKKQDEGKFESLVGHKDKDCLVM